MTGKTDRGASRELGRLFREGTLAGSGDAELLERLAVGRGDLAFEALVGRHGPMVRRVCLDLLGDPNDAEDASQATFARLFRRAGSIRSGDSLATWLHRVAVRAARRVRSEAVRRRLREERAGRARLGVGSTPLAPLESLAREELRRALHEELDRLPDRHRSPLILCGLEGLSLAEAAARLGESEGSVRGRLARGKARLRSRLARRGLAPAAVAVAVEGLAEAAGGVSVAGLEAGAASWAWSKAVALLIALGATLAASAWTGLPSTAAPAAPIRPAALPPPRQDRAASESKNRVKFRVRVVGPVGEAVQGARVFVNPDPWSLPKAAGVAADGSIRFDWPESTFAVNFAPGTSLGRRAHAVVFALADGFGMGWSVFYLAAEDRTRRIEPEYDLTVRLVEDYPISGRLVGPDGWPVAGAEVSLDAVQAKESGDFASVVEGIKKLDLGHYWYTPSDDWIGPSGLAKGRVVPTATTDAEGHYRFAGVGRDRRAGLSVAGPGIGVRDWVSLARVGLDEATRAVRERYPRHPVGRDPEVSLYGATAEVVVDPERTVAGLVRDARTGRPLPGVKVRIRGEKVNLQNEGDYGTEVTADDRGRYRSVRREKYDRIVIRAGGEASPYLGAARELEGVSGIGEAVADFSLEPGVVVAGRVVEAGTGRGMPASDEHDCHKGYPHAGYLYYRPLAGNPRVVDSELGLYYRSRPPWQDLGDPVGTIVTDGAYRAVVPPGPGVLLVQHQVNLGMMTDFGTWAESSGNHRRFPYALLLRRAPGDGAGPGGDEASLPGAFGPIRLVRFVAYRVIDPTPSAEVRDLIITIPRTSTRRVRLVGPDGEPVRGATVSGLIAREHDRPVILEGDGFEALALDPTRPRPGFALSADGRLSAGFELVGDPAEPLVVRMDLAPTLTGRVLDPSGKPIANADGFLGFVSHEVVEDGEVPRLPRAAPPRTDADGLFLVRGLFPGQPFRVFFKDHRNVTYEITPKEGLKLAPGEARDLSDVRPSPVRP